MDPYERTILADGFHSVKYKAGDIVFNEVICLRNFWDIFFLIRG